MQDNNAFKPAVLVQFWKMWNIVHNMYPKKNKVYAIKVVGNIQKLQVLNIV